LTDARTPGLRLQIILALAALMVVSFVPLYVAVASLTRAALSGERERAARSVARSIAADVASYVDDRGAAQRALGGHVRRGEVDGLALFFGDGTVLAAPASTELSGLVAPGARGESLTRTAGARAIDVALPAGGAMLVVRVRYAEEGAQGMPLVRLVALYMMTFGVAIIVFAYFALTRLIVRPIESLAKAADAVANGGRTLEIPHGGAREVADLGASVRSMTAKLVAEEREMRTKVDELTEATRKLKDAQSQLVRSERMASVGRLAAGIAHEIGNPIAAILGFEELILAGDLPRETERDFLQRMKRETERINGVVRDLLDFARPEQGGVDSASPPADVGEVAESVAALARPQKTFRDVAIEIDVADDVPDVALSASRLTQVLLNLVLNAGAVVADGKDGARVTVRAKRTGDRVRIEVEDTGPGVPADLRERIFEPFVTTKDVGEGTGLGLSVCRGLVEAAGGSIGVDASYASGARFVVELPAA
jgi:two-component system, NtrC family, sensor kinase